MSQARWRYEYQQQTAARIARELNLWPNLKRPEVKLGLLAKRNGWTNEFCDHCATPCVRRESLVLEDAEARYYAYELVFCSEPCLLRWVILEEYLTGCEVLW